MSSSINKSSFLIVEKQKLQCIFQPLKSNRIKYTCFEVSQNLLIMGATSGGLYLFRRDPCVFLQLIPNKEGPVNNIALSSDEKLVAFSSLKGVTCVLEIQDGDSRIINRSVEHVGSVITSLIWTKEMNKLYLGDNLGRLSVINVSLCLNKNIFHIPAYVFMKLDSAVVQISCYEEYLLISTKTRCYICDTMKEQYKQIGTQLREGFYGATFIKSGDGFKIYCARPGSRLWEVDDSGNVISTHHFKKALAVQSSPVVRLEENELILKTQHCWPDQSFNFYYLFSFLDRFLLTFKSDGIYIFDAITAEVILWSDFFKDIVAIKYVSDIIYLWTSLGHLHTFVISPLSKCLIQLYFLGKYQLCINVLEAFLEQAMSDEIMSKVGCLVGLQEHYSDISKNQKVYNYIQKLTRFMKEKQLSSNLDSGIFLVDNKHWKKWKIGIKTYKSSRKKKFFRCNSMSDMRDIYKKSENINKKFNDGSLPDIWFSANGNHTSIPRNSSDDFTTNYSSYFSNTSFMNQIPFLSLTSPDIIQSTIIELGHNVKKKLYNGTKSLQNKFHTIEEKFKFSKPVVNCDIVDLDLCWNGTKQENIVFPHMDGSIVYNQLNSENLKEPFPDIVEIRNLSEKINASFDEEDTFILFKMLYKYLNDYNQNITSYEVVKKSFPFKQLLPEKNVEIIKKLFHRSLEDGWIDEFIDQFRTCNMKYLDWQEHPSMLQEIHKTEDLVNDIVICNIILMFSEILDPYSILQSLENLKLSCTFFSFSIILDIFQETSFNFFTSRKDLTFDYLKCPLPYLLNMLFLMLRLDQIESACHIAVNGKLTLHYISYLILKLSNHLEFTGLKHKNCIDRCNKLFLNFLMKLKDNSLLSIIDSCDTGSLYHIEHAFFALNKHLLPKCHCKYPLIGSAKYSIKCPEVGKALLQRNLYSFKADNSYESVKSNLYTVKPQILKNINHEENSEYSRISGLPCNSFKSVFYVDNLVEVVDNSETQALYSKIISLLHIMPDLITVIMKYSLQSIDSFLPFIVQFGKINVLDEFIDKGSFEFWSKAFSYNKKLSNGFCCICQRKSDFTIEVDWNQLSVLTLKSLGASETIKLMMKYADIISSHEIDISFFRACLLSDIIQKENGNGSALIDTYCNQLTTASRILKKDSGALKSPYTLSITGKRSSKTFSVDIKSELCAYCSLPLTSDNVSLRGKIRIFKCCHVYHISCLKLVKCDYECLLC